MHTQLLSSSIKEVWLVSHRPLPSPDKVTLKNEIIQWNFMPFDCLNFFSFSLKTILIMLSVSVLSISCSISRNLSVLMTPTVKTKIKENSQGSNHNKLVKTLQTCTTLSQEGKSHHLTKNTDISLDVLTQIGNRGRPRQSIGPIHLPHHPRWSKRCSVVNLAELSMK